MHPITSSEVISTVRMHALEIYLTFEREFLGEFLGTHDEIAFG